MKINTIKNLNQKKNCEILSCIKILKVFQIYFYLF